MKIVPSDTYRLGGIL